MKCVIILFGLLFQCEMLARRCFATSLKHAAFGDAASLVSEMKVRLSFKGITYQTLTDPEFRKLARDKFPSLQLMDEFDAARGEQK